MGVTLQGNHPAVKFALYLRHVLRKIVFSVLQARPDLRKSFFDIFMDYEKKWLNVLTDTNLSTHLYNVISIVYNGSEVPFMLFG